MGVDLEMMADKNGIDRDSINKFPDTFNSSCLGSDKEDITIKQGVTPFAMLRKN